MAPLDYGPTMQRKYDPTSCSPQGSLPDLLVACIEAIDADERAAAERLLSARPDLAPAVRERLRILEDLGMLDGNGRAAHREIGGFELIRKIGSGGMGVVWLARDTKLDREVAIKMLRPGLAESGQKLLVREAKAIARLEHPSIVTVHNAGEHDGVAWIAMEYVDGRGLDEVLRQCAPGTPDTTDVLSWGHDIASALDVAHRMGVVHRDIKPSNIRITGAGRAVLLDFGLARSAVDATLTASRGFEGSPCYASPEQVRGDPVGPLADVYSLGITLYECLAGQAPFVGHTTANLFHAILTKDPTPLERRNRAVSSDLAAVVARAVEKEAHRRYESAAALVDDLEALQSFRPTRARPVNGLGRLSRWIGRHRAIAALSMVAALALVALPLVLIWNAAREADQRASLGRAALATARERVAALTELRSRMLEDSARLARSRVDSQRRPEVDWDALWSARDGLRDRLAVGRIRRRSLEHNILELLARSRRLGQPASETRSIEIKSHIESWRITRALESLRNPVELDWMGGHHDSDYYRERLEALGAAGRYGTELHPTGTLTLATVPPGAEVFLFAYRSLSGLTAGGEDRLVPVPYPLRDRAATVKPGTRVLRVTRDCEPLRDGDLVIELAGEPVTGAFVLESSDGLRRGDRLVTVAGRPIHDAWEARELLPSNDLVLSRSGQRIEAAGTATLSIGSARVLAANGGLDATVVRDGMRMRLRVRSGARLVPTACPLVLAPENRAGTTPLTLHDVPVERYLAVFRSPNHDDVRRIVEVRGQTFRLPARSSGPPGFVSIEYFRHPGGPARCWVSDHEVTCAEYLEFLNDAETRARIDGGAAARFPRSAETQADGGFWQRSADGRYRLPADWHPSWPILGVSWDDAKAFARWRTERAKRAGSPWRFMLPRREDWSAATGEGARLFPWGSRFRPTWTKGCFARYRAVPEEVISFAVDETPLGLFDTSGGAYEWIDQRQGDRGACMGGSWQDSDPVRMRHGFFNLEPIGHTSMAHGFRLAAWAPDAYCTPVAPERR